MRSNRSGHTAKPQSREAASHAYRTILSPWWLVGLSALVLPMLPASGQVGDDSLVGVIVQLQPGLDRTSVRAWTAAQGGRVRHEYRILPDVIALRDIRADLLVALRAMPGVIAVTLDRRIAVDLIDSVPGIGGLAEQLTAAGVPAMGVGVRVCICDTGINPDHFMYMDRIDAAAGLDIVNDDPDPIDDNGHGSHIAGVVAGGTGVSVDFLGGNGPEPLQGVAPQATLIAVKVFGEDGSGSVSDAIAGIDHCTAIDLPGGRADVINLSFGDATPVIGDCDATPLAMAVNNAVAAGVVVVTSSGNNAFANALQSPACASQAIAVGATYDDPFPNPDFPPFDSFTFCTNRNVFGICIQECTDAFPAADQVACYSNRSDNLDVTAPGSYIWSAVHDDPSLLQGRHGTSQAAAHVSGLAALLLGRNPLLTPADVRQAIRDGAVDLGPAGFDATYGYGRVDVLESLLQAGPPVRPNAENFFGVTCLGPRDAACSNTSSCVPDVAGSFPGTCYVPKNRYLSIDANPANSGLVTARRVSMVAPGGSATVLGWVGPPVMVTPLADPPVWVAPVVSTSHYTDWSTIGATLHVGDCEIRPGDGVVPTAYLIEAILEGSDETQAGFYSAPLLLETTAKYGDVAGPLAFPGQAQAPDDVVSFLDIFATVASFQGVNVTVPRSWVDTAPDVPDGAASFGDIFAVVGGFASGGTDYPFAADPCTCPGACA